MSKPTEPTFINTSADDLKSTLHHMNDIAVLEAGLKLVEKRGQKTKALHIKSRLRALRASAAVKEPQPDSVVIELVDTLGTTRNFKKALAKATVEQLKEASLSLLPAAEAGDEESVVRHDAILSQAKKLTGNTSLSVAPGGSSDPKSLQIVAPGTSSTSALSVESSALSVLPEDSQLGQQVTAQYRKAIGATREILIFGAMLLQVENRVVPRDNAKGPWNKGQGLRGWLAQHAPEVNYNTAAKYKRLAEAVHESLQLAAKTDFVHLLTAPIEDLAETERKKREKLDACIEDKSQRKLLFDFGIDTKGGKDKGGAVNAGKTLDRRTKEEIARDEFEAAAQALCKLAQTNMDKVLTLKGPKEEAAVWLLDADALEKLKLAAFDLHAICVEAQSRRKTASR